MMGRGAMENKLPNYLEWLGGDVYFYGISGALRVLFSKTNEKGLTSVFKMKLGSKAEYIYSYINGRYGVPLWYLRKTMEVWEKATGKSAEVILDELLENVQEFGLRKVRTRVRLPRVMSPDLAYLAGVIVGDGWILSNGNMVGIVNGDENYLRRIGELFRMLFNFNVIVRKDPRKVHTYLLEAHSKVIVYFLTSIFGFEKGKKVPIIPAVFKNYPKSILIEFIAGFFDTDGSVDEKASTIKFTQKSKEMLIQIKEELANVHIQSSLYFDKRWSGWDMRVSSKDKKKFFTLIRPRLQKKKVAAEAVLMGR
jgi:intein/homing endonuclease